MTTNPMEKLLGLGQIQSGRVVPGMQAVEGREYLYVSDRGKEGFAIFFRKLIRYVSPPIPKSGGAMIEGCKIVLPTSEVLQAISYKGDIEGWRSQIEQGAAALNADIARIDRESIVLLSDAQSFRLAECKIYFRTNNN